MLEGGDSMMYNYMGNWGGMMFFAAIFWLLVTVALVLGIAALWKYINKK